MDPFKLFGRLLLLSFKIAGYLLTGIVQTIWYLAHGKTDRIGDVIGCFGRSATDAVSDVFSK